MAIQKIIVLERKWLLCTSFCFIFLHQISTGTRNKIRVDIVVVVILKKKWKYVLFLFLKIRRHQLLSFLKRQNTNKQEKKQHWEWSLNVLSCHKIVSCTYFCCYSAIYLVGVYFIFMSDDVFFFVVHSLKLFGIRGNRIYMNPTKDFFCGWMKTEQLFWKACNTFLMMSHFVFGKLFSFMMIWFF